LKNPAGDLINRLASDVTVVQKAITNNESLSLKTVIQ